jgi:hypothetical protein
MGKTYKRNDRHLYKGGKTHSKPKKPLTKDGEKKWKFSARDESDIFDDMRL